MHRDKTCSYNGPGCSKRWRTVAGAWTPFVRSAPTSAPASTRLPALVIYGSNALEGNTLTLGETISLIREGRLFPFTAYLEQELLWSYDQALDVLEGRTVITTDDLIRRFAGLEQRGLGAAGISPDERRRQEAAASRITTIGRIVEEHVTVIAKRLAPSWPTLQPQWSGPSGVTALDRNLPSGRSLLDTLGLSGRPILGTAAHVALKIVLREESAVQVPETPSKWSSSPSPTR